jgi:hypothetical protein
MLKIKTGLQKIQTKCFIKSTKKNSFNVLIMGTIIDKIYSLIEEYSSRLNVWSWQKRWGNRQTGTGYGKKRKM